MGLRLQHGLLDLHARKDQSIEAEGEEDDGIGAGANVDAVDDFEERHAPAECSGYEHCEALGLAGGVSAVLGRGPREELE